MTQRHWTPVFIGALLVSLSIVWGIFVSRPTVLATAGPLDRLESALLDARYSTFGPISPSPQVVIVAIDDATLESTRGSFPNNRSLLAGVINRIADAQPKVLGLDVILADAGVPETDAQLAAALARINAVIAAAGRFRDDLTVTDPRTPETVLRPQSTFLDAATSGLVNLSTDAAGTPRYLPVIFQTPQGVEPAFAVMVASAYAGLAPSISSQMLRLGNREIPLDEGLYMPLRLLGPTASIPTYSAEEVLSGQISDELSDKVVILGYTATAFGDRFPNPFDESVPGAEIIATAVSQILGAATLRRDTATRRLDAVVGTILAALVTVMVVTMPLSAGVPLALGGLASWLGVVWYVFSAGIWLSASVPLVSAIVALLVAASWRYIGEKRSAARGARALAEFKQFQSPALADMIAHDPGFLRRPTERTLSVFFVDLSSFTNLSEKLGPAGTQDLLKLFHQITAQTIEAKGGIVLNYMGDGALAVFGVASAADEAAEDALNAAFDLVSDLKTLGPRLAPDLHVGCRIGLHHGDVILSRLGGDRHQQVSVAGDTVNLASRLLEVAKEEKAIVAVTDTLLRRVSRPTQTAPGFAKSVSVRGRDSGARVHFWRAQDMR